MLNSQRFKRDEGVNETIKRKEKENLIKHQVNLPPRGRCHFGLKIALKHFFMKTLWQSEHIKILVINIKMFCYRRATLVTYNNQKISRISCAKVRIGFATLKTMCGWLLTCLINLLELFRHTKNTTKLKFLNSTHLFITKKLRYKT